MVATEKAMFAAGCFWGVQSRFDELKGVSTSEVGYSGGHRDSPTYEMVCHEDTGHAEVCLVEFNPQIISYRELVRYFFSIHDPTQLNRQGPDYGKQYRSAIFFFSEAQKTAAQEVSAELQTGSTKKIVTEISAAKPFYRAEEYHQKYNAKRGIDHCPI